MLEPYFIQPLGLVAEATVLKEHGVDMCVVFFCDADCVYYTNDDI